MQTIDSIVNDINEHIERLQRAKSVLTGEGAVPARLLSGKTPHSGRYTMSREARERISKAQKERWAKKAAEKEAAIQKRIAEAKSSTAAKKQPAKKRRSSKLKNAPAVQ